MATGMLLRCMASASRVRWRLPTMAIQSTTNVVPKRLASTAKSDEPVRYSTSKAKTYDSMDTFVKNRKSDAPDSQGPIITICVLVLIFYFMLVRESNHIDDILSQPLEKTVPNIGAIALMRQIEHYEHLGLDTRELRQSLKRQFPTVIMPTKEGNK